MSSINLKVLQQTPASIKSSTNETINPPGSFTYSDVAIDFALNEKDVKTNYDIEAIKDSIENLFNTIPGQWILNPTLGIGLQQYLFSLVDEFTGKRIADAITNNLTVYEPRVRLQKLSVIGDPDNNLYEITMAIQLTNVNNSAVILNGTLANSRFQFN